MFSTQDSYLITDSIAEKILKEFRFSMLSLLSRIHTAVSLDLLRALCRSQTSSQESKMPSLLGIYKKNYNYL